MRRGFDPCSYPQVLFLPFMLLLFFMSTLISYVGVSVLPSLPLFGYALVTIYTTATCLSRHLSYQFALLATLLVVVKF